MGTIYVVYAVYAYDGTTALKAFRTKEAAIKVHRELESYLNARPVRMEGEEDEPYWERVREWVGAGPKGFEDCDYFIIDPIELEEE